MSLLYPFFQILLDLLEPFNSFWGLTKVKEKRVKGKEKAAPSNNSTNKTPKSLLS